MEKNYYLILLMMILPLIIHNVNKNQEINTEIKNANLYENENIIQNMQDNTSSYNKDSEKFDIDNVNVNIKENSLNEAGFTLIIQNNNSSGFYHYPNWELEKLVDGEWKFFVLGHQETYDENAIFINKNSSEEIQILFSNSYTNDEVKEKIEKLEKGKYRIKINIINTIVNERKEEKIEFEI